MQDAKTPERKPAGWFLGLHYIKAGDVGLHLTGEDDTPPPPMDFIFIGDILAAIANWKAQLKVCWAGVKPGGVLILWVPDVRVQDAGPHRFTTTMMLHAMQELGGCDTLEDDLIDGHVFQVHRRGLPGSANIYRPWRKKAKHCLAIRHGAFGDVIQVSSVLPTISIEHGYVIDFALFDTEKPMVEYDPHIDRFWCVERKRLSDPDLGEYWQAIGARFDRVLNFSWSAEGTLLPRDIHAPFYWSHEQRARMCSGSYLDAVHRLAGVSKPYRMKFYPTKEESAWVDEKAAKLGPFIFWQLHGSGIHKWWPYAAQAVARLLAHTPYKIVLAGGPQSTEQESKIIDAARDWIGDSSRIFSMVDNGGIRKSIELARSAAVVVGPETGLMNAVALDDVPKVVILSHSTPSNLTDDWINTVALPSRGCPESACHRLHNGWAHCHKHEPTGAALCAASLPVVEVLDAIARAVQMSANVKEERLAILSAAE